MNRLKLGKDLNNKMLEEVLAKEKELKKALDVLKDQQEKWMGQQFSFQKPTDLWIQKMENLQKLIDQIQTSDLNKGTDDLFKNLQKELCYLVLLLVIHTRTLTVSLERFGRKPVACIYALIHSTRILFVEHLSEATLLL
jgi:uncharacterized protein YukE